MRLTPTEHDRLLVFTAAELARATLARGLLLNAPEAIALVCDEMHQAARRGAAYEEIVTVGRTAVTPQQVIDGVADISPEIRLEVFLDEGSRLIVLREPFGPASEDGPGAIRFAQGEVQLAADRERIELTVTNTSDHPVRVSSHFPFDEVNAKLEFDRDGARGFRLDLPSGDSLRWGPGQQRRVTLVAFGGGAPDA
ncbi:MAG: urease subunit gamma/beta [Actinomycetota bacterium]|nr:urease subunit gamma/beta [Actinomycetota bacterium]